LELKFQENKGWFVFFGTLATAGLAEEALVTASAAKGFIALSEEEVALGRIGQEFREAAVEVAENNGATALEIDILKNAASGKGNFGLGIVTEMQAKRLGEAWVGTGYRVSSDGDVWISADKLRQFRLPSQKNSPFASTGVQANMESRLVPYGEFQSNGHLDIRQ
jgi:hypothetical protein